MDGKMDPRVAWKLARSGQRSRKFRAVGTLAAFDLDEFGDRFGTEAAR
jgi:hypothetical protein